MDLVKPWGSFSPRLTGAWGSRGFRVGTFIQLGSLSALKTHGGLWWSSGEDSALSLQWASVLSLLEPKMLHTWLYSPANEEDVTE